MILKSLAKHLISSLRAIGMDWIRLKELVDEVVIKFNLTPKEQMSM
jgi:hypothetical protein